MKTHFEQQATQSSLEEKTMNTHFEEQATQSSLEGVDMDLGSIGLPPGLEHLVGPAPSELEVQVKQQQVKLERPPGNFNVAPTRPPGNFSLDVQMPVFLPTCHLSMMQQQLAAPTFLPPFASVDFHMQTAFAKQPVRPPGNWDNISLASTALDDAPSPMGSPRRAPSISSDEGGILQFHSILEDFMPGTSGCNSVEEMLNRTHEDVYPSTSHELETAAISAHQAGLEQDGHLWVRWHADAKKLNSKDRQMISPSFEIAPGVSVKIMIKPKCVGDRKGQASLKKSRGVGAIEVKFVEGASLAPRISFCVSVGEEDLRGPVEHDFSGCSVCTLPKSFEEWNFASCVHPGSSTFLVSLKVLNVLLPSYLDK